MIHITKFIDIDIHSILDTYYIHGVYINNCNSLQNSISVELFSLYGELIENNIQLFDFIVNY